MTQRRQRAFSSPGNFGLFVLFAGIAMCTQVTAQPPGPGGGPNTQERKIVSDFDSDNDGILNAAERKEARDSLQSSRRPARRVRRGPGGRAGNRPTGTEGPRVEPSDVKSYPSSGLYDEGVLRTFFLEFEQPDWEQELEDFKPTDVEVSATLIVDGKTYPNVGVSFRGASSFFMVPAGSKRSLNLSMDFVDDDQRLHGYKSLNLLNCNGDSSMMSSLLYTHIARHRIAAPKVNFVKVVINGRSWGIYANAQQFNKDFLKENYDSGKGARWKVGGNPRGDGGLRYLGEDLDPYRERFEIKSADKEKSWKDLIHLCKVLNETPVDELETALDPILDIDGVLWFLAVDVALINSDGYWTRASDYSIYQNKKGKFHLLPHDMNEAFRASRGGPGGPGPNRSGNARRRGRGGFEKRPPQNGRPNAQGRDGSGYKLDPLVGLTDDRFPLRSKLLANETLRTRYLQHIRTIAEDLLAWEHMGPRVNAARNLIDAEVRADTRKLMTYQAFQTATSNKRVASAGSLQEFCEKRAAYLLNLKSIQELPRQMIRLKSDNEK